MIEIVLTALGLGLFLSFSFGPVFFELINTSLRKGFKAAFLMETGVLFSDLVYLFLASNEENIDNFTLLMGNCLELVLLIQVYLIKFSMVKIFVF